MMRPPPGFGELNNPDNEYGNKYYTKLRVKNMEKGFMVCDGANIMDVDGLRRHIVTSSGVPYDKQLVVHRGSLLLDKWADLDDLFEDVDNRKLELEVYSKIVHQMIDVVVVTRGGNINLQIASDESVLTLKKMIDLTKGVSPRRQELEALNILMHDDNSIDEYVTCNPLKVHLMETPQDSRWFCQVSVIAVESEETACLEVEFYDTIFTLHGQIRRAGLAEDPNFYLEWKGNNLDGNRTLSDYGIEDGDIIYLKV